MTNEELNVLQTESKCVQAGYQPKAHEPRIMPIVQSTTYRYDDADELAKVFDLSALEYVQSMYSRLGNPTVAYLEEKLACLEGGIGAMMTSSGQAAVLVTFLNLAKTGDHFIALSNLYGGVHTLLGSQIKRLGIEVSFVSPDASLEEMKALVRENTKGIYAETIGNPDVDVLDFEKVSALAKFAGVPLIVDNTFGTPYLCNPIAHGADIVLHSTTKYIDGHATSVGGIVINAGTFDWTSEKFPQFSEPDPDYHGLVYNNYGKAAFLVRLRASLLRDMGTTFSPFNAFLTNLGLETLHLRMARHSENALAVAKFLENHEKIEWVNYPGLESSPSYERTKKYLPKGASGVVSFGVKGGKEAAKKFTENTKLANLVVHVGDIRTCLLQPAMTTHRQLSDEELLKAGVRPEMIRFNVGIEHIDDIIKDLSQALDSL